MNVGPLYNRYLHPRNYTPAYSEDYDYSEVFFPDEEEQICREPEAEHFYQPITTNHFLNYSYSSGFPEDSPPYMPNTPITSIPELAQIIPDIKQSYSVYYRDDQAKASEKIAKVDNWKVSDLLNFVSNVKSNWDKAGVQDAFGEVLFKIRTALLQGRISLDFGMSGLETGDLSFTRANLFTTDALPQGANLLDSLSKKLNWDQRAWSLSENDALKEKIREAYKNYWGDQYQAKLKEKNFENWTVGDLFKFSSNINEKLSDPTVSESNKRKIRACFTLLLSQLEETLKKMSPESFTSAWSTSAGLILKEKIKEAYKAYWGEKEYEKVLKRKNFENWTVADLINFYNKIDTKLKEIEEKIKAIEGKTKNASLSQEEQRERERLSKNHKEILECFVPLRPQLQLTLLRVLGISFSPAEGANDPKVKFFLETIYPEVVRANEEAKQQTGQGLPGFPTSEILSPENVQWFITTWGMLKRQELGQRLQADLAVLSAFEKITSRSTTPPPANATVPADDYHKLLYFRQYLSAKLANDPKNLDDPAQQATILYDLVRSDNSARLWYEMVKMLPKDHLQQIEKLAKQRALAALLGDNTIRSDKKDSYFSLRNEITRLNAEKQVNDLYYQMVLQNLSQLGITETDLADRAKVNSKARLTDKAWQIIDRHTTLQKELQEKTEALAKAEQEFIGSVGERWAKTVESQKIAILWQQTKTFSSYEEGNFPMELQEAYRAYFGKTLTDIKDLKLFVSYLTNKEPVDGDTAYANALAYQIIEKQNPASQVDRDYLAPAYARGYLTANLPVVYEVRKQTKTPGADSDTFIYREVDFNDPKSVPAQTLLSLFQLAVPDGKVTDPAEIFTKIFDGKLDKESWFRLFPNEKKTEQIQDNLIRTQLKLENIWKEPAHLAELAKNLGLTVDSPEFSFLKSVLTGQARIIIKAKYVNGLIARESGKEVVEFFKMEAGTLLPLTASQQAIFQKLYESYIAGRSVTETSKLQYFLNTYPQDFQTVTPGLENLAFELATNIAKSSKNNSVLQRINSDPKFKELFFSSLFSVLGSYASDNTLIPPKEKLTQKIQDWFQNNFNEILAAYTRQSSMSLDFSAVENPLMEENLRLVEDIKDAITQVCNQLLQSQFLSSTSSRDDLNLILNNLIYLSERIVTYLKSDFTPLKLNEIPLVQGDLALNKTAFFVIDSLVVDVLCRNLVSTSSIEIVSHPEKSLPGEIVDKGIGWLTGETDYDKFQSMHQWLWLQPAAVVLLYFHSQIGNFKPFDYQNGVLVVRNQITAEDIEKLSNWQTMTKGEIEKGEKLRKASQLMKRYNIVFGNEIFESDARIVWNEGISIPGDERQLIEFVVGYLREWHDNISRITQPVAGYQYEEIVQSRARRESGSSFFEQMWNAASQLPAPVVLKRMQMIESDRILALKEDLFGEVVDSFRKGEEFGRSTSKIDGKELTYNRNFFEGAIGDAFSWDAELIYRFADRYAALFEHSIFNTVVAGEASEELVDDPSLFLKQFARDLRDGKIEGLKEGKMQLALEPTDDERTKKAKLLLQGALMLWSPGMSSYPDNTWGWLKKEGLAAEQFVSSQIFGMDDTTPYYNYPLRFKSFLLKVGYKYTQDFSLQDGRLTSEMIQYAGKLFAKFNESLDPEAKKELLKIFKKSESALTQMAEVMKNYGGGDIRGLGYTDANDSPIEAALVFFVRNIVPNYGMVAEGEADANFVNLPLLLAAEANKWQVNDIQFGGVGQSTGTQGQLLFRVEFKSGYVKFKENAEHQVLAAISKGLHFGLFIHPTIQLGMQAGLFVKLCRSLDAGDLEGAKRALKDMLAMRLSFFAFQYNFFALFGSAANNALQGNYAEAMVDFSFGMFALRNCLKLLKSSTNFIVSQLEKRGYRIERKWVKKIFAEVKTEASVLSEKILFEEGKFDPKLKLTFRRVISGAKDIVIEPVTKFGELTGLKFTEQHTFWKNMIYLAQNPEAIIEIKGAQVPVLDGKERPTGEVKTIDFKVRARDLVQLYRSALSPSVFSRAFQAITSFVPGSNKVLGFASQLLGQTRPGTWVREHTSRLHGEIIPNLLELNAEAIQSGRLSLQDIMQATQLEAGSVMEHKFRFSAGNMVKRFFRWAVLGSLATNDAGMMMRDISKSMPLQGIERLGGRYFVGKLIQSGQLGKPAYMSWKEVYSQIIAEGGREKFSKAQIKEMALRLYQDYYLNKINGFIGGANEVIKQLAPKYLSPAELEKFNKTGVLTEKQFKSIFEAERPKFEEVMKRYESFAREGISKFIKQMVKNPASIESSAFFPSQPYVLPQSTQPAETNTQPQPVTEDMIIEEKPLTEPVFDFETEVKRLAIEGSVKEAFEEVDEVLRRRFVKAVEIARANGKATTFVIEEGVRFGNGGQQALEKLIEILETGKAPSGIRVFVENGTIYFDETMMSRVGRSSSTVSFLGTGTIAELFEPGTVELAENGRLSVAEEFKASAEQAATAKELAKAMGLPENSSIEKVQEEIGKRFGERWVEWLKGNSEAAVNFRKSARYQELLRYIATESYAGLSKGAQKAVNTAGFAIGILSFFAVEEILDIVGVENKSARFASVILGGHVVATASTKALSLSVTPAGRTLLTTMVKNPAPALVNGLKNVKWVEGAGNLLMGVGYAVLASNLYNNLLNAYGISSNSWLRSAFPQFVVGMGGAVGLTELAARTALGRAAIPFAVAHLASTVMNLFDSDYEQSVQERAHEKMRLELAGGGVGSKILLMTDIVANLISGGAFGEWALSKGDQKQFAQEDARQIQELQPKLLETLRSLWMTNDLFNYDGSAHELSFFENPELPYQKLAEILKQRIEFKNERPIIGYRTIPGNCSYRYGEEFCASDQKIPIYDPNKPEVREKSAYEFIMNNPNLDQTSLVKRLKEEFNIQNVAAFLQKVELKNLQNLVSYLVSLEPETVDPSTLQIADNRKLREIFKKDGTLKSGKGYELVVAMLGSENASELYSQLSQAVIEYRKNARLQALLAGAQPTEVDKQLGLVTAEGKINENSPVYTRFMQAVEQTLFAMNR